MSSGRGILIRFSWIGLFILTGIVYSCRKETVSDPATQKMIDYLSLKRDSAQLSTAFPYFTDRMLAELSRSIKGLTPKMAGHKVLDYALVLILNGQNVQAREQLLTFLDAIPNGEQVNNYTAKYYRVLALAWIREAEQTNCIQNHSAEACIVPLEGEGVHLQKTPALEAIKIYEKLLAFNSHDYQSRWFYNIAHMAVGTYPNGLDEKYVLNAAPLKRQHDFPTFRNVAMSSGVGTRNHAGGVSIFDFNNDGLEDIFTSSYGLADQSTLYLNTGKGNFVNYTEQAGILGLVGGLNCIHGDFNNDGFIDVFIARGAWLSNNGHIANSLLINDQGKRFVDRTESAGLLSFHPTGAIACADIDLDGDLDIFVGNESSRDLNASEMFLNDGTGIFSNKASALNLEIDQFVKGAVWGDVNNDMYPDLFVSCYGSNNRLYINKGIDDTGNVHFEEIVQSAGVSEPLYSFTTWFWDYNQDGHQDIFVSGYDNREPHFISDEIVKEILGEQTKGTYPKLYRNEGDETFTDVTDSLGLNRLIYMMGGNFGDLNSDGYPDFYAGTGEFNIWATIPNRMFQNMEGGLFREVTTEGGFGQIQKGHGVAFADLDNDGDQDIYHQVGGAVQSDVFHNMLFENPGFGNQWIKLKLHGTTSNHSAIGAAVEIHGSLGSDPQKIVYAQINTGGSFGANSLFQSIGLGKMESIDSMLIRWPHQSKPDQWFYHVDLNSSYEIIEPDSMKKLPQTSFTFSKENHHHH